MDRVAMLMAKRESIRDVIAFPKNKAAQSLMDGCPSEVSETQLKDLHLRVDVVKK